MSSSLNSQHDRVAFVEKQIDGNPWLFGSPEERAIIREVLAIAKETHLRLTEFMKRFEEGEG